MCSSQSTQFPPVCALINYSIGWLIIDTCDNEIDVFDEVRNAAHCTSDTTDWIVLIVAVKAVFGTAFRL